jgi:type I restriction enzyme, S subunit
MISILLGDLFELKYGKSLRKDTRREGTVPVFGSNGQVDFHNESLVNHPTIIVGRKGSIGEVHLVKTPCWPIDTTYFVEPLGKHEFDLEWLYRLLKTLRLPDLNRSAAIPGLNRDDVYRISIVLPPLDDQIRIAYLLGRVERLITERKQHLQQLADLLKSAFMDMFGPRAAGYEGWPIVEVKDLAANHKGAMRTGPFGSNLLHSEFSTEGDVAVLGIDNAVQNRFAWGERRFITQEKYKKLENYRIWPGDVIVTIMGTIGRSAVIPSDIPLAINTKHLAAITLDRNLANPSFLSYSIHSSPFILKQLQGKNRGAIMSGLNLGIVKKIKLKCPPITLQNEFAEIHERIDRIRTMYQQSQSELEVLYAALSQSAFKGELDLSQVRLPEITEREKPMASTPSPGQITAPEIKLPETELLLPALEGRKQLKPLLDHWLESYRDQLGDMDFSVERFLEAVQTRISELQPEVDFQPDAEAYEHTKGWVYDALSTGRLKQAFREKGNKVCLVVASA